MALSERDRYSFVETINYYSHKLIIYIKLFRKRMPFLWRDALWICNNRRFEETFRLHHQGEIYQPARNITRYWQLKHAANKYSGTFQRKVGTFMSHTPSYPRRWHSSESPRYNLKYTYPAKSLLSQWSTWIVQQTNIH
jgi:hypothetical protein